MVYLPVSPNSQKPVVFNLLEQILVGALGLRRHDVAAARVRQRKNPPEKPPPLANGAGLVFKLDDKKSEDQNNRASLEEFKELSNDSTRNVMLLSITHSQSTDAQGANTLYKLGPFSDGHEAQIVGRAHRLGAQNNYPLPSVLELVTIFYPEEVNAHHPLTRLSCDALLQRIYDISAVAENQVKDAMRKATYACAAMSMLREEGLTFLPHADCLHGPSEIKHGGKASQTTSDLGLHLREHLTAADRLIAREARERNAKEQSRIPAAAWKMLTSAWGGTDKKVREKGKVANEADEAAAGTLPPAKNPYQRDVRSALGSLYTKVSLIGSRLFARP